MKYKEELERLMQSIIEYRGEPNVATFRYLYKNYEDRVVLGDTVDGWCHRVLSAVNCVGTKTAVHNRRGLPEEVRLHYFDWLVNRSAYAKYCIEKDAKAIIEAKALTIYHEDGRGVVAGAACLSRLPDEFPHRVDAWHKLCEGGFSEAEAYLVCLWFPYTLVLEDGITKNDNYSHFTHSPDFLTSYEAVERFVNGEVNEESETIRGVFRNLVEEEVYRHFKHVWPVKTVVKTRGSGLFKTTAEPDRKVGCYLADLIEHAIANKETLLDKLYGREPS